MPVDFVQEGPELSNPYARNLILQAILQHHFDSDVYESIDATLHGLGQDVVEDVDPIGRQAELSEPSLKPYSAWGKPVFEIEVSQHWRWLHHWSAKNGLIADGYERSFGDQSRIFQMAKLHLFHPSSAFYSCPLAMTDGAAKVMELHKADNPVFEEAFRALNSRDGSLFWTSGQWMTEKTGGSDVSGTSTTANANADGTYSLSGIKWFSSATTSQMALGLAKIEDDEALSLFHIPVRNDDGGLNGIEVLRLKDKMGTKALPTAELRLKNTRAHLIGEAGKGVRTVATMLNITRLYNSVCSVAQLDRGLQLLTDYSHKRKVFGKALTEQHLHVKMLSVQKGYYFAGATLTFQVAALLGKDDLGTATEEELILLRLLTPLAKLYTAKRAIEGMSEVLEGFGGAGYIEDTRIPTLFKDAQVFPIWEGATNVLSLDLLRVFEKTDALQVFLKSSRSKLENIKNEALLTKLKSEFTTFTEVTSKIEASDPEDVIASSRGLAFAMSEFYAGLLMAEICENTPHPGLSVLCEQFVRGLNTRKLQVKQPDISELQESLKV
ncbi:MAG: acyl-CoA dehydrogenase family protein [Bdellovibrionales bacterium]|nr:acyl-CoA dehydrogenase family protein [Bdellovibrionales bacterium]